MKALVLLAISICYSQNYSLEKAVEIASSNDVSIALTLSDPFCVARHSQAFTSLIKESVDILHSL